MRSTLGDLILWLHSKAIEDGRLQESDEDADAILIALVTGKGNPVGVELYRGKPNTQLARTLLRKATARLANLQTVLRYIDDKGYTTISIRALLSQHYQRLRTARIGTPENDVYIDLDYALARVSDETRYIAAMLVEGQGPKEVGEKFNANGSRRISRACVELLKLLERRKEDEVAEDLD